MAPPERGGVPAATGAAATRPSGAGCGGVPDGASATACCSTGAAATSKFRLLGADLRGQDGRGGVGGHHAARCEARCVRYMAQVGPPAAQQGCNYIQPEYLRLAHAQMLAPTCPRPRPFPHPAPPRTARQQLPRCATVAAPTPLATAAWRWLHSPPAHHPLPRR